MNGFRAGRWIGAGLLHERDAAGALLAAAQAAGLNGPENLGPLGWVRRHVEHLSMWEQAFIVSLAAQRRPLSARQREKLAEIHARVAARMAAEESA